VKNRLCLIYYSRISLLLVLLLRTFETRFQSFIFAFKPSCFLLWVNFAVIYCRPRAAGGVEQRSSGGHRSTAQLPRFLCTTSFFGIALLFAKRHLLPWLLRHQSLDSIFEI
jgi:hypothetical protein